jgi:hypothetical protein
MDATRTVRRVAMLTGLLLAVGSIVVEAQSVGGCGPDGYRVVAERWDAVLRRGWEWKQSCAHPEWPVRLGSSAVQAKPSELRASAAVQRSEIVVQPLLIHAGDAVRVWSQDRTVRIEMAGVAEQTVRVGESVVVRVTQQSTDEGPTVEHVTGVVRGVGDVEIER